MDQDAIADACVWESVRLIHPAANGAGVPVNLLGERPEIEIVV
jgi:hypothetical protein